MLCCFDSCALVDWVDAEAAAMEVSNSVWDVAIAAYSLLSSKDCWNAAHAARVKSVTVLDSCLMQSVRQDSMNGGMG